jgi:FkbM family methyltransferase
MRGKPPEEALPMDAQSPPSWADKLKTVASRNRPSQKPQLWENLSFALRRRVEFEVSRRLSADWLDRPRVVRLSQTGFDDGQPPLQMTIVPREVMNKSLFLYGALEVSETRLVQALLRPGMCVVDVGANIGFYTLVSARIVGPSGAVHAFEPNGVVRASLVANLALNGFQNVVVHDEAMASQSGSVLFYVSDWNENSGISSLIPGDGLKAEGERVPCVTLDDFAATLAPRHIDVLKIDVEGAELDVIKGGRELLGRADAPALIFEGHVVEPLVEALRPLGYHVRKLDYTLATGLEMRRLDDETTSIFSAYEPPNYFAVKDPAQFELISANANARRLPGLQLLGKL